MARCYLIIVLLRNSRQICVMKIMFEQVKKLIKYVGFLNKNPIVFLKSSLVYVSERNGYRIDPISMMVANLPDEYKIKASVLYYKLYNVILPRCWNFTSGLVRSIVPIVSIFNCS